MPELPPLSAKQPSGGGEGSQSTRHKSTYKLDTKTLLYPVGKENVCTWLIRQAPRTYSRSAGFPRTERTTHETALLLWCPSNERLCGDIRGLHEYQKTSESAPERTHGNPPSAPPA